MSIVFLSYDDPQGSTFFYKCAKDLKKSIVLDHRHNLTCSNTIETLAKDPKIKFYCVYSHGNESGIYDHTDNPVITLKNSVHFANSIFYTMACKTAKKLGVQMHKDKCTLYYGFIDSSNYYGDEEPLLQQYFIDTHNYAFKLFESQEPIKDIMTKIESYYESKMNEIRDIYPFARALLRENLDRIVIYYNNTTYRRS